MKTILLILIGFNLLFGATIRDDALDIVTDNATGLIWQDDINATVYTATWQGAIDYCESLTLGGYDDWRLPNINELLSIVDYSKFRPAIKDGFINVSVNIINWSGTSLSTYPLKAWFVHYNNGGAFPDDKGISYYVRCVRGGQ